MGDVLGWRKLFFAWISLFLGHGARAAAAQAAASALGNAGLRVMRC